MKTFTLLLLLTVVISSTKAETRKIFCYYGSWATYTPGNGQFNIEDIDPWKCTHVSYAFIGLNEDGTVAILDEWNDISLQGLSRFVALRNQNPNLKVLISMGGWNEGSERYSDVTNNPELRANMVNSVYDFVHQWGFDGFDLDWEYPAQRGGRPEDKYSFIAFLRELRQRFGDSKLITAAVGAGDHLIGTSYDVINMNIYLDYINLMTYDFHGYYDGVTGQNSPLFPRSGEYDQTANIAHAVYSWIHAGANPQKVFVGLGFYGHTFQLADPNNNGVGAPVVGPGESGPYTDSSGFLSYLEICTLLNTGGWTTIFDYEQMSPYSFRGDQWIGYDNAQSIRVKSQYAISQNLAGAMLWSIDYDDNTNVCGSGYFPLLDAINSVIHIH